MRSGLRQLVEFMRTAYVVRALYVGRNVRLNVDIDIAGTVVRAGSIGIVVDLTIDPDAPLVVYFEEAPEYASSPNVNDITLL
jgi:hypothetical protein